MIDHPRLLIVDDDDHVVEVLVPFFEQEGYHVAVAGSGAEALTRFTQFAPHVVLLDVRMPGTIDGREVLRRLRQKDQRVGVIMLSQFGDAIARGRAIQEGADDYVQKPFEAFEVLSRVQGLLRRVAAGEPAMGSASKLRCGELLLDRRAGRAYLRGEALDLPPKPLAVLEYLMSHPGELITRERLLNAVWGYADDASGHALENKISGLRRQLHDSSRIPRYIETLSGRGYQFIGEVEALP